MVLLLLAVTSVIVQVILGQYEECNPLVCLHYLDKLFIHEDGRSSCLKIRKLKSCLSSCLNSQTSMEYFVDNFDQVKNKICTDETEGNIGEFFRDACVAERKFQMIGCLVNTSTLSSHSENKQLTTCRKALEAENCPQELLMTCENSASYATGLISAFLKPLKGKSCNYEQSLAWNIPIDWKYSGLVSLMKCLDNQNEKLLSCMPEKATTNIIHSRHGKTILCRAHEKFVNCVNSVVLNHCEEAALSYFAEVMRLWYKNLVAYCSTDVLPFLPLQKTVTSTEIVDAFSDEPKNHSLILQTLPLDVIIVHFWSMDDSAASTLSYNYLISLVLAVIFSAL